MLTTGKATGLLSMFALIATMQASEVCGQSSDRLLGTAAWARDNL